MESARSFCTETTVRRKPRAAAYLRLWRRRAKPRFKDYLWRAAFGAVTGVLFIFVGWVQYTPFVVTAASFMVATLVLLVSWRLWNLKRWVWAEWGLIAAVLGMLALAAAMISMSPPVATARIDAARQERDQARTERDTAITEAGNLKGENRELKRELGKESAELKEANSQLENRVHMRELREQLTPFLLRAYALRASLKADSAPPHEEFIAFRNDLLQFANEHLEKNQIDRLKQPRAGADQWLVGFKDGQTKAVFFELHSYEELIREIIAELR